VQLRKALLLTEMAFASIAEVALIDRTQYELRDAMALIAFATSTDAGDIGLSLAKDAGGVIS
jgi:hypothetical protein